LHGRLLALFAERSSHFVVRFQAAASDRVTATRMAHDLKSEAALLGARQLSTLAAELELACAEDAPQLQIEARLDRVREALAPVLHALNATQARASTMSAPGGAVQR
jgi:two-component system, sensor histidine kinase and response regulator